MLHTLRAPSPVVCLLLGAFAFLLIWGVRATGNLQALELMAYDLTLRLRPVQAADSRIVVVAETEADLRRWGYPLSDDVMAQMLERLGAAGARVIGVDKYRDIPVPPGSERLERLLRHNPDIVWVTKFGGPGATAIGPPKVLEGSDQVGFNDIVDDPGGIVRRALLFLDDGHATASSLPLVLALRYLRPRGIDLRSDPAHPDDLRLGRVTVPPFEGNDGGYVGADAAGYQFLLDFAGMPARFETITIGDVLDGKLPPGRLAGKIVIVGTMAKSINDYFFTPYSHGLAENQRSYGVELFGYATSQLLRFALDGQPPIRVWGRQATIAWTAAWCLLGGLVGFFARALRNFLLSSTLGAALIGSAALLAMAHAWWIPAVPPMLGFLLAAATAASYMSNQERRQRAALMRLFSSSVSDEVAADFWAHRDQFLQGNRPKPLQITATVLFSDVRGFTTISERMPPQQLMDWLNEYMDAMASVVSQHHGLINKYIGDAVMALFGAPVAHRLQPEIAADAVNAVECALAMEREVARLNALWEARGLPAIEVRIGIFTGPLVAGSLGGNQRLEYTVIGDTVNVAERLESYAKDFTAPAAVGRPCRILIGESTFLLTGGRYRTEAVGAVALKGKNERVSVYQVIGPLKEGEAS